MLDSLTTLIGCLGALGIAVFVGTLAVALIRVFATAFRVGAGGSSQVRRVNYVWFRRLHRVFWAMYGTFLIYVLLQALRS